MIALKKIMAGAAIAGSLGVVGLGFGSAVAEAAPPATGAGTSWAQDRGDHGWNGHDHGGWNGGGWNGGGWNNGPGWYGGGPVPGGWNGGWEPNGGFCLGGFCV